ncbi:hypothetical protein NSQ43_08790 [Sporosarcina sp. FSL W8-0480]
MTTTDTWWETIFEGNLSLGLNKERISDLNDENFLFFDDRLDEENEHAHS